MLGRKIEVSIIEDDVGRFSPKLKHRRLYVLGAAFEHLARTSRPTGETDLADLRMRNERLTRFRSARKGGYDAVRDAGFFGALHKYFHGEGRYLWRLDDDGIAS